jgi:hypothetical protein
MTMATEVAMVVIVTVMPTGPGVEACIIWPVDGSVVAIAIIAMTVAVVVPMVAVNAAQYQCRCDAQPIMIIRLKVTATATDFALSLAAPFLC